MKTIGKKFLHHIPARSFPLLILGFFFFLFSFQFAAGSWQNYSEWKSDDREWFTYFGVEPFQEGVAVGDVAFAVGEAPRFSSDNIFLKSGDIRWEDTLKCRQEGGVELYDTQYWPKGFVGSQRATQRVLATENRAPFTDEDEDTTWSYTEEPIHPSATECKICGVIFVYTPKGHEKTDSYCVEEWFKVNI